MVRGSPSDFFPYLTFSAWSSFKSDVFTVRDPFDAIFPLTDSQAARPCPRASSGHSFKTPARTHHFISHYLARCPSKPEHTASSDRGPCTNTDLLFSCPSPFLVARTSTADLDPFIRYVTAFPLKYVPFQVFESPSSFESLKTRIDLIPHLTSVVPFVDASLPSPRQQHSWGRQARPRGPPVGHAERPCIFYESAHPPRIRSPRRSLRSQSRL
ncbi:hypothetical protein C8F01DRAFT_1235632 [Mycena amicta]|nr:hypothetical protein C8F01DRAFT_1235632 [Mycena amicta]